MLVDPHAKPEGVIDVFGSSQNWRVVGFRIPSCVGSVEELIDSLKKSIEADYLELGALAFAGGQEADRLARVAANCVFLLESLQQLLRDVPIRPSRQEMLDTIRRFSEVLSQQEAPAPQRRGISKTVTVRIIPQILVQATQSHPEKVSPAGQAPA